MTRQRKRQINAKPGVVETQAFLPPDKGKVVAQLEQNILQPMNQRLFQFGLGIFVLEIQELQMFCSPATSA